MPKATDTCPYCDRDNCVDDKVYKNIEYYGDKTFHVPCKYCGKMIYVYAVRSVRIVAVTKSDRPKDQADF